MDLVASFCIILCLIASGCHIFTSLTNTCHSREGKRKRSHYLKKPFQVNTKSVRVNKRVKVKVDSVKKVCQSVSQGISSNFCVGIVIKFHPSRPSSFLKGIFRKRFVEMTWLFCL